MKKSRIFYIVAGTVCAAALLAACSKENAIEPDAGTVEGIAYITASLSENDGAKTSYAMEDGNLKTFWSAGDQISITPGLGLTYDAGTYEITDPGSTSGLFKQVKAVSGTSDRYGVFYPGDKIKSLPQFTKFSYEGQTQSKSDPMGHIGSFHSMWVKTADYSTISFAGADQSSCLKLTLQGMTFANPVRIEVRVNGFERFYSNNYANESYSYYLSDAPAPLQSAASVSLNLDGYGQEDSIEAWIMMSNHPVSLCPGDDIVVYVYLGNGDRYASHIRIRSEMTLGGGKWHNLKINRGWTLSPEESVVCEWDGDVVELQKGSEGLNLVIMGDGFIEEDFSDGTYDSIMRQAYNEFFSIEPYTTLKNDFTVSYVKVVSPERVLALNTGANGAENTGHITRLSSLFTPNETFISGNDALAMEYAKKALGSDADEKIKDATVVVMVNQACRAGTCHNSMNMGNPFDYGQAVSVAYCALGRNSDERIQLIHHEICGHGFGKLDDEYYYTASITSTQPWINQDKYHSIGLYRNADKFVNENFYNQLGGSYPLTTKQNVYWADLFDTLNDYESAQVESLGVFEGGATYRYGFCRPTEDGSRSIMNSNTGIFNAVSRRQIYYRYLRLSGQVTSNEYGTEEELSRFLTWDAEYILPKILQKKISGGLVRMGGPDSEQTERAKPFASPVLKSGHWIDGRFVPEN